MPPALAPGHLVLGRYRLERLLGEGGMGVVWAAEDVETARSVALKLIREGSDDPEKQRRSLREARAASAVRHPNVVTVLSVLELDDGSPVLVMELLVGEPLREKLRRDRRLALPEVASLLLPVVSAVGAAHALGIVHRDLKPDNIFISRGADGAPVVKVLDFGIAKIIALDGGITASTGITTGVVVGTPAYMSPEQVFGEKDIDHRADVWALGIVAYECLSGTLPTAGDNVGQVLKNVLARPIAPLADVVPGLPDEVSRLVERMLSRDRDGRPDLREVHEVLRRYASAGAESPGPPAPAPGRVLARDEDVGATRRIDPLADTVALRTAALAVRRVPPRRWRWLGAAALLMAAAAGAGAWAGRRPRPPLEVPVSPLEAPSSVIACPILAASGVDEPAGWLGAAAAATVCERARLLLGGRAERTLVPAELLGLPPLPTDSFPADPFGAPEARDRSVEAARRRAAAWVDGEVIKDAAAFRVSLVLRRPDGGELGRASGSGRSLYQAAREAMSPLVPRAKELDPGVAAWSRAHDIDAALALLDVTLAMAQNGGGLADECARCDQRSADLGEMGPAARWLCAYTLGLPPPPTHAGAPGDASSPAAYVTRVRLDHMLARRDAPEATLELPRLFEREPSALGRSLIAATASCLLQSSDSKRASEMAFRAVQADPKNLLGEFCRPWGQLVAMTQGTASADTTVRAMQAWAPWDSAGWYMQAVGPGDTEQTLAYARRAYTLTPFDTNLANILADKLLSRGAREEVRNVALAMAASGHPVHQVDSALLLLRVDGSLARFGAALGRARHAMEISPGESGWVQVLRFEVAWRAIELGVIVGRAAEIADLVVERFLDPEPPPLDGAYLSVPTRIPAICVLASEAVGRRCFARFHALRGRLSGGILPETDAFAAGAERYAARDFPGAARAWRPLLREPGLFASVLPDAMAETFERTGETELVERVDALAFSRAGELNGATLAHARAARRAAARGDRPEARALARQVIEAWSVADETVPAVEEMRRLLAGLR